MAQAQRRPALRIETATLPFVPDPRLFEVIAKPDYEARIKVRGGWPPYEISLTSGELPAGLTLSEDGLLRGRPTEGGRYDFTIAVVDANRRLASRAYTVYVSSVGFNWDAVLDGHSPTGWYGRGPTVGERYDRELLAEMSGLTECLWRLIDGSPPPGLTVESIPGGLRLAGTPSEAGSFRFVLESAERRLKSAMVQVLPRRPLLGKKLGLRSDVRGLWNDINRVWDLLAEAGVETPSRMTNPDDFVLDLLDNGEADAWLVTSAIAHRVLSDDEYRKRWLQPIADAGVPLVTVTDKQDFRRLLSGERDLLDPAGLLKL